MRGLPITSGSHSSSLCRCTSGPPLEVDITFANARVSTYLLWRGASAPS